VNPKAFPILKKMFAWDYWERPVIKDLLPEIEELAVELFRTSNPNAGVGTGVIGEREVVSKAARDKLHKTL